MIIIKKGTISDLENAPNCAELMQEYAAESALSGLPAPVTDLEKYKVLEEKDLFHAIGAWLDDKLIGWIGILSTVSLHYGVGISFAEGFFVLKEHRNTLAGLQLLGEAERYGKQKGSFGLFITAPIDGELYKLMKLHRQYTNTHALFFRGLSDA